MKHVNVLIVDDSFVSRGMLASMIEDDANLRVVGMAASAAEADTMLENTVVNIVTLDLEMPRCSGWEYLPSLVRRRIPTVIVAGGARDNAVSRKLLAQGAAACIDKAELGRDASCVAATINRIVGGSPATEIGNASNGKHPDERDQSADTPSFEMPLEAGAFVYRKPEDYREPGPEMLRFACERIGLACLQGDQLSVEKWMNTALRLDRVLELGLAAKSDRRGTPV